MANTLKMMSPPGYGAVVPLDKQSHAGMGLTSANDYRWCGTLNAVFLNAVEMARAAMDYPIAFARDERNGEFMPIAVLGLRDQQNLFVNEAGQWKYGAYVPAYFRRFPFCIAEVPHPNGEEAQRLVCVQQDSLTKTDKPLFDAKGEPTDAWTPILKLLEAVEGSRQQTRVLVRRLEALDLLTPFDAIAMPREGEQIRLKGMFRVDDEKLKVVPSKDLRVLMKRNELRAVYAHLISLENFARLMEMSQKKT